MNPQKQFFCPSSLDQVANICTPEAFEVTLAPKHRVAILPIEPGEETRM